MREHGTLTCYRWGTEPGRDWTKGCRCDDCRVAAVTYNKIRERRRSKGIETLFDNTEAREHLQWLSANNVGWRTVHQQTGLSQTAIRNIRLGRSRRSRRETIDAILAVGTHNRADHALVDAGPTWRLIQDMLRYGHTKTYIAGRLGSSAKRPALQIRPDFVRQSTADAVVELHAQLVGTERELMRVRRAEARQRQREEAA